MADSPVFEHTCRELEQRTGLDRLAARGTVRIALRNAGLDVASVDATQMGVVLRRVLPKELGSRGVEDGEALCEAILAGLEAGSFDVAPDRAGAAASTLARFGS